MSLPVTEAERFGLWRTVVDQLLPPVALHLIGACLVLIAVSLAIRITNPASAENRSGRRILDTLGRLDGQMYQSIMRDGYTFSRDHGSTAVFFPGYPCVAWTLHDCGMPGPWALLTTSWLSLLGALILGSRYVRERLPEHREAGHLALAALALYPMGYCLWFMYSEALFLFLLTLLLALLQRRAPPVLVALACGALTGVRSAGVAAVPVVLIYAWAYSSAPLARLANVGLSLIGSAWGIGLFAWHLHAEFGDALAFVHAQEAWGRVRHSLPEKLWSLATFGPLWRAMDPAAPGYGIPRHPGLVGLFSNQIGDAVCWLLGGVLLGVGAWKRWLNWYELLLGVLLFAFATWFQADRTDLASQGRYMSVIFPGFLVAGRLLAAIRWEFRVAIGAIAAGLYVNYAVNFAVGNAW
jgi:hypothetical protein